MELGATFRFLSCVSIGAKAVFRLRGKNNGILYGVELCLRGRVKVILYVFTHVSSGYCEWFKGGKGIRSNL